MPLRTKIQQPSNDAFSHAIAMVAVPLFFGWLGHLLDQRVHIHAFFVVVFAAVGVAGSFFSAYYRYIRRSSELEEGKPWTRRMS